MIFVRDKSASFTENKNDLEWWSLQPKG